MRKFKKKFNIKKEIIFKIIALVYDQNPYISKPNKEIIYKFKKYIKLNKGIEDLKKKLIITIKLLVFLN